MTTRTDALRRPVLTTRTDPERDWTLVLLGAAASAVAAMLAWLGDFGTEPRFSGCSDWSGEDAGCPRWWSRAGDVVLFSIGIALVAVAPVACGVRGRVR